MFLRNYIFLTTFALCVLQSCTDESVSKGIPFEVEQKNNLPGEGRASAVAFALNGKGYVACGRDANGTILNDCWLYDPVQNSWTKKNNFPGAGRVKAVAAVVDGIAYVGLGYAGQAGGFMDKDNYLRDFWMYNPANDTWSRRADFPDKYTSACACFVYNHVIYVGSGFDGTGSTQEFWKYIPAEDRWVAVRSFPGETREVAVACAGNNRCYFGTGYQCRSYNDWWEYIPATDSWKEREKMPDHGRQNTVAFVLGDRYFVATGRYWKGSVTDNKYLRSDIIEYDPAQNRWISRGSIPGGRESAIGFTIDNKAYIGFGENDSGMVNDFWCVSPVLQSQP